MIQGLQIYRLMNQWFDQISSTGTAPRLDIEAAKRIFSILPTALKAMQEQAGTSSFQGVANKAVSKQQKTTPCSSSDSPTARPGLTGNILLQRYAQPSPQLLSLAKDFNALFDQSIFPTEIKQHNKAERYTFKLTATRLQSSCLDQQAQPIYRLDTDLECGCTTILDFSTKSSRQSTSPLFLGSQSFAPSSLVQVRGQEQLTKNRREFSLQLEHAPFPLSCRVKLQRDDALVPFREGLWALLTQGQRETWGEALAPLLREDEVPYEFSLYGEDNNAAMLTASFDQIFHHHALSVSFHIPTDFTQQASVEEIFHEQIQKQLKDQIDDFFKKEATAQKSNTRNRTAFEEQRPEGQEKDLSSTPLTQQETTNTGVPQFSSSFDDDRIPFQQPFVPLTTPRPTDAQNKTFTEKAPETAPVGSSAQETPKINDPTSEGSFGSKTQPLTSSDDGLCDELLNSIDAPAAITFSQNLLPLIKRLLNAATSRIGYVRLRNAKLWRIKPGTKTVKDLKKPKPGEPPRNPGETDDIIPRGWYTEDELPLFFETVHSLDTIEDKDIDTDPNIETKRIVGITIPWFRDFEDTAIRYASPDNPDRLFNLLLKTAPFEQSTVNLLGQRTTIDLILPSKYKQINFSERLSRDEIYDLVLGYSGVFPIREILRDTIRLNLKENDLVQDRWGAFHALFPRYFAVPLSEGMNPISPEREDQTTFVYENRFNRAFWRSISKKLDIEIAEWKLERKLNNKVPNFYDWLFARRKPDDPDFGKLYCLFREWT